MDWTTLGGAFSIFMQTLATLFLIYGALLSIASVLPERWFRRFDGTARQAEAPRDGVRPDQVVTNS
jgi:hypothetical protein